jgi:hypothetical protein
MRILFAVAIAVLALVTTARAETMDRVYVPNGPLGLERAVMMGGAGCLITTPYDRFAVCEYACAKMLFDRAATCFSNKRVYLPTCQRVLHNDTLYCARGTVVHRKRR